MNLNNTNKYKTKYNSKTKTWDLTITNLTVKQIDKILKYDKGVRNELDYQEYEEDIKELEDEFKLKGYLKGRKL